MLSIHNLGNIPRANSTPSEMGRFGTILKGIPKFLAISNLVCAPDPNSRT
ncbi:MAG: hypothetical protein WBD50_08710 [Candidatus Rhabdochlamydia sp.]